MQGYVYVKIVAEAVGGRHGPEEGLGVRPHPHVQHPRIRLSVEVDGVGRAGGADALPRGLDPRDPPRRGAEQGRHWSPGTCQVEAPDPLPAVVASEANCFSRLTSHETLRRSPGRCRRDIRDDGGEIVAVVGPNGAGKSTLLKISAVSSGRRRAPSGLDGDPVDGLAATAFAARESRWSCRRRSRSARLTVLENALVGAMYGRVRGRGRARGTAAGARVARVRRAREAGP